MTPHVELLLQCSRRRPEAEVIHDLARRDVDWPAFVAMAVTHDLQSHSFWRLQQCCVEAIPSVTLDDLRRHFRRNADRNLFMTGELFRIIDRLERGGVPAAAFKGPVFAWSLYENPSMREYMDLDLFVHRGDIRRAMELLGELGYRSDAPLPGGVEVQFFKYGGQLVLIRDAPSVILDLHWDLAPRSMGLTLAAETLWPHLIQVPIAGRSVLSFDLNDQLTLCALHGGKHGWTTLAWLTDIDAIVRTGQVDWDRVLSGARGKRLSRALFLGLRLSCDLLNTPIPSKVLERVREDSASAALAQDAKAYLINGPGNKPMIPRKVVYQLRLTEGRLHKLQLLWRNTTEPKISDSESLRIRPSLFWLYYCARPCRLALKYVWLMASRLRAAAARSFGA